jgi:hypothetical protein
MTENETVTGDVQPKGLAMVECFISKRRVPASDTVEVERNGRRVLVHKRFADIAEDSAES